MVKRIRRRTVTRSRRVVRRTRSRSGVRRRKLLEIPSYVGQAVKKSFDWTTLGAGVSAAGAMYNAWSGTGTTTKEKGSGQFNSGYHIVSRRAKSRIRGKRLANRRRNNASTLAKLNTRPFSFNINLCNEIENSRGRILIPNTTPALNNKFLPLILIDLDRLPNNNVSLSDPNIYPAPQMYTLRYSTGNYAFSKGAYIKNVAEGETPDNVYTYSDANTASSLWSPTQTSVPAGSADVVYQKRLEMDLLMYGQNNQDTMFRIDVVRIDPQIMPDWDAMGVKAMKKYEPTSTEWNTLWHSLIASYTQNPLYKPKKTPWIKFVKSYSFRMPEQSADFDQQNCVKTHIRVPLNRIINKLYKSGAPHHDPEDAAILNNATDDSYNGTQSNAYGDINPKHKLFVMIRATNTDNRPTYGDTFEKIDVTPGQDPTFDLRMRLKYVGPK